ncbi:MAG: murein L,D-transpeptidase [Elusimicrobiota bacterium]
MMLKNKNLFFLSFFFLSFSGCIKRVPLEIVDCVSCEDLKISFQEINDASSQTLWGEKIYLPKHLKTFYQDIGFRLVWSENGDILPSGVSLINELKQLDGEGLNPQDYHLNALEKVVSKQSEDKFNLRLSSNAIQFDLLMSDAFLMAAKHLLGGRALDENSLLQWKIIRRKADLVFLLHAAILDNKVAESLESLVPTDERYVRLKEALLKYRKISRSGGWKTLSDKKFFKKGDQGPLVSALKKRLMFEVPGVSTSTKSNDKFDTVFEKQVKAFQRAHGLPEVGEVGPATIKALNVSVVDRIHQIKFSLDRFRWLPIELGARYLIVNIPQFRLQAYKNNVEQFSLPTVVGKDKGETQTPEFSDEMTYIEFSPEWNVPRSIAVNEILPKLQEDPKYVSKNKMEVFNGDKGPLTETEIQKIEWCDLTPSDFPPYRFRQKPGPWNSLGSVKFMFPNPYNVYIHGTTAPDLFDKRLRTFSHGCIRLKDPIPLAKFVLEDPDWTEDRIRQYLNQTEPVVVHLAKSLPVYIVYWTAWVGKDNWVSFRDDIYGLDQKLHRIFYSD